MQTLDLLKDEITKARFLFRPLVVQFLDEHPDVNCTTLADNIIERTNTMNTQFNNYFSDAEINLLSI